MVRFLPAGRQMGRERSGMSMRFGPYEVVRLVGQGATASVYECRHRTLGRRAAVKVLHPHLAQHDIARRRFLREGRALSRIVHTNVIDVFDVGEDEGMPYLVMSLAEGEELGEYVRRNHPLSVAAIADCILPVVAAVRAAHEAGVVHRDLKPSNVRVSIEPSGALTVKVLDFGISKLTADHSGGELTSTDGLLGTAGYMPPEQLRSAKCADERSDVYALGVILYQCATGERPFRGEGPYEMMHAIMTAPVMPPSALRSDVSPEFDAIVLRALKREPSERFASARDLGVALATLASDGDGWARGFALSREETVLQAAAKHLSGELEPGSLTLPTASTRDKRGRSARMGVGLVAGFLIAAWLGALGWQGRRADGSLAVASTTRVPDPPASTIAAETSSREEESPQPPPAAGKVAAKTAPRPTPSPVSPRKPAVATSVGHESGTNGAPILE
jgi:serine/threonine protein kinase